ncbi:DEKNAAC102341 [Brettanomyces naardenensis]|uniref:DEKNAAC102341 n=1 Tax=Brettanomyces naardenensis TaxID=13370 RepID=A0A448YKY2_BRENA|nr:DEKNAAC102341 [Brettanomyces naardenensis]
MSTFEHQGELQKLPIPPLEDSIRRYCDVLQALQTESEHQKTVAACEDFLKTSGPILQQQLIEYAKNRPSYIEQFWYDSYLNFDNPVVLNVNPFIMIEDDPTPLQSTQVSRAASLTSSTLRFIRALRKEELTPDMARNRKALDMDQYPKLFGSARIPTQTGCLLQTDSQSRHIVVLSRSQFYWFDVLDDDNELILTEGDIRLNYKSIVEDSQQTSILDIAKSSFGILTTENRRVWSNLRTKLNADKINNNILSIIDSALFVLVLDDIEIGEDLTRLAKNFLCGETKLQNGVQVGTCTNRWYDKLQLIITKDAKCGINFEHTGVDGHTVLRFASDIYTDSILRFARTINTNSPSLWKSYSPDATLRDPEKLRKYNLTPRKLEWNLTKDMSLALRFGETRLSDLIHQNEFATLEYKKFAKDRIKKMGMSPDAFVQLGFQLAYYALYGKIESTYEPAMTKMFYHGRTEAIRTVSEESNRFVTKFLDDHVTVEEKLRLLREAGQKHQARTKECSQGLGQDRHLYALFCIWKRYFSTAGGNISDSGSSDDASTINFDNLPSTVSDASQLQKVPPIFADGGWDKLNNTIISTSNCGNPSLKLFGFGPVSPNGFGVGYIIKDNWMTICASSKHRQTQRFLDTLNTSFNEMERTYIEATRPKIEAPITIAEAEEEEEEELDDEDEEEEEEEGLFSEDVLKRKLQQLHIRRNKSEIIKLLGGYDSFEMDYKSDLIKSREQSPEPPFSRPSRGLTPGEIEKKLRLAEY